MRILHSLPSFRTALMTAQMSLRQSWLFPLMRSERLGWQLLASLLNVIR